MNRIEIIDFLKGYAIFTIIVFHYCQVFNLPSPYNQLTFLGGTGAHLFILLSGLGLYLSQSSKLGYLAFLKHRAVKVYFPYIVVVLISALIALFMPIFENSWYALGGHVFLYKMFDNSIVDSYGHQLWFISTILQFYLVFKVLVWLMKKLGEKCFLIFSFALSFLWSITVLLLDKESARIWNSFFLQFLWEFALGMVIAARIAKQNYKFNFKIKPFYFLIIGILNCALYGFLAIKGGDSGRVLNDIPAIIGYASLAIWFYQLNIKKVRAFFVFTGKISFSIFLLHILILKLALAFFNPLPTVLIVLLALGISYLSAIYFQKTLRWI